MCAAETPVHRKLVSVITPTYGDPSTLLKRCVPSVEGQTYSDVEHIVVVDGRNNLPSEESSRRRVVHLGRRWHEFTPRPSWGTMARLVASGLARGDYIGYIDHDDELLPGHVEKLVDLLESAKRDWVYSQMAVLSKGLPTGKVIGDGKPRWKNISTQMLLHKAEMFHVANWDPYARAATQSLRGWDREWATYGSDWDLVRRWLKSGAKWAFLPEVTVRHHRDFEPDPTGGRSA